MGGVANSVQRKRLRQCTSKTRCCPRFRARTGRSPRSVIANKDKLGVTGHPRRAPNGEPNTFRTSGRNNEKPPIDVAYRACAVGGCCRSADTEHELQLDNEPGPVEFDVEFARRNP